MAANLKMQFHVYWGLIDVTVLPSSSYFQKGMDAAVIHALIPLKGTPAHTRLFPTAYQEAVQLLKEQLPEHGLELRYLDEFKDFDDVQWQNDEDIKHYRMLVRQALSTRELQLGRLHPYCTSDDGQDSRGDGNR